MLCSVLRVGYLSILCWVLEIKSQKKVFIIGGASFVAQKVVLKQIKSVPAVVESQMNNGSSPG